jgi:hypothetical protein
MSADALETLDRAWLASRGLLPRVRRELAIDRAISGISLASEDEAAARAEAENRWADAETRAHLGQAGVRLEDFLEANLRARRLRIFQERTWKAALPGYFLKRKSALDQAVYWLLRTRDRLLARELYFRIKEGEEDFATVAANHSEGPEAQTCGMLGPSPLGSLAPALAKLLLESQPGQLRPPMQIGEWAVIVRLQGIVPCQLDAEMEERLYGELLDAWLEEHLAT